MTIGDTQFAALTAGAGNEGTVNDMEYRYWQIVENSGVVPGGGSIAIPDDQFFNSTAARDAYFTANPDKLVEGARAVVDDGTGAVLYEYSGSGWKGLTSVTRGPKGEKGDPGKDGKDGADHTGDINQLEASIQVLESNLNQKINGIHVEDVENHAYDDITGLHFIGATVEDVTGSNASVRVSPKVIVADGQTTTSNSMETSVIIFPQGKVSPNSRDPKIADVTFHIDKVNAPITVDDTQYSYDSLEFVDFTAVKEGGLLKLTAPTQPSSGVGIEVDNGASNAAGVTKLNFPTSEFLFKSPTEVSITPYGTVASKADKVSVLTEKVYVQPPLKVFSDPDEQYAADIYIDPNSYEPQHAPSFLGKIASNLGIVGTTRGASDEHDGVVFFDNAICPAGEYIEVRRAEKAYGIQDPTEDDPNVSGGTVTELLANFGFIGNAPVDGFIRCYFMVKKSASSEPEYLTTPDGRVAGVQINYKAGEKLRPELLTAIVQAKGIEYVTVHVMHTFDKEAILLDHNKTYLCISQMVNGYKTSLSRIAFQSRLGVSVLPDIEYLGVDMASLHYYIQEDQATTEIQPGEGLEELDQYGLYNLTKLSVGISGGVLTIANASDGSTADFYFDQRSDHNRTQMLRGHNVKYDITLEDKNAGWNFDIFAWTGDPDKPTPIFESRNNGSIVVNTGWTKVKSSFISEDVVSGQHKASVSAIVPTNANLITGVIYPVDAQSPITLKLSEFTTSADPAFTGYLESSPVFASEAHLEIDEEFKQFTQDNRGVSALRYTINDSPTPLPSGYAGKGLADIALDTTVHQIAGSGSPGGEGAIKFLTDGNARISTSINLYNETQTDNEVTFWWAIFDGSSWTKIADSETVITVPKQTKADSTRKNEHTLATFDLTTEVGTRIGLFAQTSIADGAYLESVSQAAPLVSVDIQFKELVAGEYDDPWAGIGLTSFDTLYTNVAFVSKAITGAQTATFNLDLPAGATFDIVSVLKSDTGSYSNVSQATDYSFSWDTNTKQVVVDFKRVADYRIVFAIMIQ